MILARRDFLAAALAIGLPHRSARARRQALPQPKQKRTFTPGEHRLEIGSDRDGLIYVPATYKPERAMPLVVMLHGAGGNADMSRSRFPLADELGFLILAPDSRDERTWDELLGAFGPDQAFIAEALGLVLNSFNVDSRRIALAGTSDGASYALSLGVGAGDIFTHVIAFSAAFVLPLRVRGKPRVFISHGTRDTVMPIDKTGRDVVRRLKALEYDVTYREFDGGHSTPPEIVREAFEWFMRG